MPQPAQQPATQPQPLQAPPGSNPQVVRDLALVYAADKVAKGTVALTPPVVTAGILAAFVKFLAALREQHRTTLVRELGRYSASANDISATVATEMELEEQFARNAADRLATLLPGAMEIADPDERERKVTQILSDEERFAEQRGEAMFARAIAALTRFTLKTQSPAGALWRLGTAKHHTPGCLAMADKFWPWEVLDRVHPPRHYGCTASLHGYGEAILNGWMTPSDVPDTREAIRRAAGVEMMAEDDAAALLFELDVRDRLLDTGMVSAEALQSIDLKGVRRAEG